MDLGLSGRLVAVTGSTGGIGHAVATQLARAGAHVVLNGRTQESCDRAKRELVEAAQVKAETVFTVPANVATRDGCEAFEKGIAELPGPLYGLVNNLGIFHVQPFEEITDEKWQEYFDTNVMSGVRLARTFLTKMLERNEGRIVFISSEVASRPLPHMVAYSVTKASQVNLARGLAQLTKGTRVTVNSVLAGPTMTDGVRKYMEDFAKANGIESREEAIKVYFERHETTSLLQRFLEPEEVGNVVLFLVSKLASGVNGAAQNAEGGIVYHI